MASKNPQIDNIMQEIFDLPAPKIQESRREEIKDFISTTVNGDGISSYLVIDTNENSDIWVYILTNLRLIVVPITNIENIKSQSFALANISNIERRLINSDKIGIKVRFQSTDELGLNFSKENQKIINFFQKLEQTWVQRG